MKRSLTIRPLLAPLGLLRGRLLATLALTLLSVSVSTQVTPAASENQHLDLVAGGHHRVTYEPRVARVAVGDPEVLLWEVLDDRELLLLGKRPGRTTLIVWFDDGSLRETVVHVQPDLSLLKSVLTELHPSLTVEQMPDREALVLRGHVATIAIARTAENTANAWLAAGETATPLLGADPPDVEQTAAPVRKEGGGVINLIRVDQLPLLADGKILEALTGLGEGGVTVRRILDGELPNDALDTFILEGSVHHQVDLVRVLSLAASVLVGAGGDLQITALADESGALTAYGTRGQSSGQSNMANLNQGGQGNNLFGGGGNQMLSNLVNTNIARARVVTAAGGRLLSFIEVEDLPQVRVDVKFYEVNVTRLQSWNSELGLIYGDVPQGSLQPAGVASTIQGLQATRVGSVSPTDAQNVLGFLDEGFSNQLQIVTDNFAVDSIISALETHGLARSLARPSLTVLSGERAQFQVGGEIPIVESFATNNVADGVLNSVSFVEFGIFLDVRPLVGEDDAITVDVLPRVATPSPQLTTLIRGTTGNNQATTSFETRSLRTSARLTDGKALVIGGLLNTTESWSNSSTPWLSSIPLLGSLFEREDDSEDELELVLVLHPVILRNEVPEADLWVFPDAGAVLNRLAGRHDGPTSAWSGMEEDAVLTRLRQQNPNPPESAGTESAPPALNE